jgi:hypothetical protein
MKYTLLFLLLLIPLLTSDSSQAPQPYMNDHDGHVSNSPAFASAVQTYVIVDLMVQKSITEDLLSKKIVEMLGRPMEDIYKMIYNETGGDVPEIFKPFYPYNAPEYIHFEVIEG